MYIPMNYTRQVNKECMTPYITEPYSKKKANARFPNKPTISLKLWQHRLRHLPGHDGGWSGRSHSGQQ